MLLSDHSIKKAIDRGAITIDPFNPQLLQSASYDLTLNDEFFQLNANKYKTIDPSEITLDLVKPLTFKTDFLILKPQQFVLAQTKETIGVDRKHVGLLEGKGSLGRLGLSIHATSSLLNPGDKIQLTLELFNAGPIPIKLEPGMKIAQILFEKTDRACSHPYVRK